MHRSMAAIGRVVDGVFYPFGAACREVTMTSP
jgi:hypothetical protein